MRSTGDQERRRVGTRRALLLATGKLALFTAITGRLYYLQVIKADEYRTWSDKNQFNIELTTPARGRIFDRNGIALAENRDQFRIHLVAEQTKDVGKTLSALRKLVGITDDDIARVLSEVGRQHDFLPVTVVENLSRADISRIAINMPYLPGLQIAISRARQYPFGVHAAHLTGYVAAVSGSELTSDPVLALPDFRIGKNGIEKHFERHIRGSAGRRRVEVNALGRIIRKFPGDEGTAGRDITLTIDIQLQKMAIERLSKGRSERVPVSDPRVQRALDAGQTLSQDKTMVNLDSKGRVVPPESGATVVMDIHHGDILILASTPSFDPNMFPDGLSPADWERLLSNPRSPMTNKAISGLYSPGSTFKMLVCLAALEAEIAHQGTHFTCNGHVKLGRARFHCWKRYGHGNIGMIDAIAQSCDAYMYELAKQLGIDRIAAFAKRFGFGEKLGIDLPGERSGLVPTPEWKQVHRGVPWQPGETLITSIGQGFFLSTPLQMAMMTARLANGGRAVRPRLVRSLDVDHGESPSLNLRSHNLGVILDGMIHAVNSRRGTAYSSRLEDGLFRFAGKTGSVQVKRITRAERRAGIVKNEDRPWEDRDHAMFVGYAPIQSPRYAIAVVVEHGGGGSRMAAPIARDIIIDTMRRDPSRTISGFAGRSGAPS